MSDLALDARKVLLQNMSETREWLMNTSAHFLSNISLCGQRNIELAFVSVKRLVWYDPRTICLKDSIASKIVRSGEQAR